MAGKYFPALTSNSRIWQYARSEHLTLGGMASKSRDAKVQAQLAAAEADFRALVLRFMPRGVADAVDCFANSEFNQHPQGVAPRTAYGETLLVAARHCLSLRQSLSLSPEGTLAHVYLAACSELASSDPHRRGPRRLAEALLALAKHNAA